MWKFLKGMAVGLGCLLVGVPVLVIGLFYGIEAFQNITYARSVFGPLYGIERVVGSQRWHGQIFGCTYAIVELTPARSAELVAGNKFRDVLAEHALHWKPPENMKATPGDLRLQEGCYLQALSNADKQAVLDGLNEPGGWAGVFGAEHVAFFLPKRNLIGVIRNGD